MAVTEAQKRASKNWASDNIKQLSCKVNTDKAEKFLSVCSERNKEIPAFLPNETPNAKNKVKEFSPNAILVATVNGYIADPEGWENWIRTALKLG